MKPQVLTIFQEAKLCVKRSNIDFVNADRPGRKLGEG